jgi:hypothetical protein
LLIAEEGISLRERATGEGLNLKLKSDLVEHYDYEAVSAPIWRYLSSWHHFDVALPRFIAYDKRTESSYLELHPERV